MENPNQAKWLIENVSGKVPQGLVAPVTIKAKGSGGGKGGGKGMNIPPWMMMQMMQMMKGKGKGWGNRGGGLSGFPAEKKVWVGGMPNEGVTWEELKEHFPGCKFAAVMKGNSAGQGGVG